VTPRGGGDCTPAFTNFGEIIEFYGSAMRASAAHPFFRFGTGFRLVRGGNHSCSKHQTKGVTVEGMREKVEGKLKETEGKLTDDELREKQGEAEQKVGEGKEQLEDAKDEARDRI
jgi:uncharacterized protein YjbJ (UPF0337 family)